MALAVIITAIFINQMSEYADYLSSYFAQEREEGFVIAHDVVINKPINEGEETAFNTALIMMPIIGTVLTVGISALYMVSFTKEKDPSQRQRITHHYLTFLNAGLAFIIMAFLEYSFGKNVVFGGDTAFGRAFSGLIRWSITYFGIRFIFMIAQIITERKTLFCCLVNSLYFLFIARYRISTKNRYSLYNCLRFYCRTDLYRYLRSYFALFQNIG